MNIFILTATFLLLSAGVTAVLYFRPKKKRRFESLYTDALNAIIRGESKAALKLLRDVVKHDSNHVDAYLQMGDILREEGNPNQAIKIHQSLTVRPHLDNSLKIDIHRSLAQDYMEVNNYTKAKQEVELILKIEKKHMWSYDFLLNISEKERDWVEAAKLAKNIQKITQQTDASKLAQFQVYEGLDKLGKKDKDGAKACFQKALQISDKFGQTYQLLGDMFAEERDLIKAIEHWEKFALLEPEKATTIFSRIETALYDLGRYSEVEKFYRRLLDKYPSHLDALARMANVLEEKGERQEALDLLNAALKSSEDSIHARLMKLKLSLTSDQPHELSRQIDEIIEIIYEKNQREV